MYICSCFSAIRTKINIVFPVVREISSLGNNWKNIPKCDGVIDINGIGQLILLKRLSSIYFMVYFWNSLRFLTEDVCFQNDISQVLLFSGLFNLQNTGINETLFYLNVKDEEANEFRNMKFSKRRIFKNYIHYII